MTFILSTILSALILTSCMILIFDISIQKQWKMSSIVFKMFLLVIALKICFPFETKLSIFIPLDKIMNPLLAFLQYKLFDFMYIYQFLLLIILIGIAYQSLKLSAQIKECKYIIQNVRKNNQRMPKYKQEIYKTSYVNTPVAIGFPGIILLPESLTEEEILFAIRHETTHIQHKDNLIKLVSNILVILFWWFPPIYVFQKQLELYIELHADNKAIENLDEHKKLDYLNFLIKMQRQSIASSTTRLNSNLSFNRKSNLNYRIHSILNNHSKPNKISFVLLISMIFLNLLILTPYYTESDLTKGTCEISERNAYVLVNNNQKQLVVNMNGENHISSINEYSLLDDKTNLKEEDSLYIPNYNLDDSKSMNRWKYKNINGQLNKRKFNAYKNTWDSDWITYNK